MNDAEKILTEFLDKHRIQLADNIRRYVSTEISHKNVVTYAWKVIDDWSTTDERVKSEPYMKGERAFWACIWSIIHLANEEHWKDGLPQRELPKLLEIMISNQDLPDGYEARRP